MEERFRWIPGNLSGCEWQIVHCYGSLIIRVDLRRRVNACVVLATVAGSQDNGTFDVYRPATRISSGVQLAIYLFGLIAFGYLFVTLATTNPASGQPAPSPGRQAPPLSPQKSAPAQQAPPPSRQLVSFKWLADVGPFPETQGCPPSLAFDRSFATAASKLKGLGDDLAGMLLIGSADTRELRPHARNAYGSNTRLAIARADCVKELLINTLALAIDVEMIVTLARAPKSLGSRPQPAQLESDRAVTILILIPVRQALTVQPSAREVWYGT